MVEMSCTITLLMHVSLAPGTFLPFGEFVSSGSCANVNCTCNRCTCTCVFPAEES